MGAGARSNLRRKTKSGFGKAIKYDVTELLSKPYLAKPVAESQERFWQRKKIMRRK